MYKKVVSLMALFLIIGCGDNSNTQENLSQKSGKVADGYLNGATVCIDINNNLKCDSDEPSTTTDKKGNYHLKFNKDISGNSSILAYGGVNSATGLPYTGLLKAPVEYNNINPISTLVSYNKENFSSLKKAEEAVSNLFSLDIESLTKDPIKQAKINKKLFKTALKIEKLTNIALSLDTDKKRDRRKIDRLFKRVAKISAKTEDFIKAIVESSKEEFNLNTSTDKLKNNLSVMSNLIDGKIEVNDNTNEAEQVIELAKKIVIKSIKNNEEADNQTIEENIEECKKNGIDSCLQEENSQNSNSQQNSNDNNSNSNSNTQNQSQNQNQNSNSGNSQQNSNSNNSNSNSNTQNQNQNQNSNSGNSQQNSNSNNSNSNSNTQNQNSNGDNSSQQNSNSNNSNSNSNTQNQNQNQNSNSGNSQQSSNDSNQTQNDNNTTTNLDTNQTQNDNNTTTNLDTNSTPPIITLNGDDNISIILGNSYKELGAKAIDDIDGEVNVTIESNVDETNLGEYKVIYKAVDSDDNEANATRVVKVVDPAILVSDLNPAQKGCRSWEQITVYSNPVNKDYFYKLSNNDWGRKYLDENSTGIQCIFKYSQDNKELGGWYWGWPKNNDNQVKGYPEGIYGAKFEQIVNPKSGFPTLVSDIESVKVDLAYRDINITDKYNIALEFWLHTEQDTSMNNIEYEIMFRFDPAGFHPRRTKIGEYEIDGIMYTVYTKKRYDGSIQRRFINFVAQTKTTAVSVDFKEVLDYLTELEFEDIPQRYMSGIEMGVEVISGSGAFILEQLDVDLRFNEKKIQERKIEENFDRWSIEYSEDKTPLDKKVDTNKTGWKWRNSNNRLIFRKKNTAIIQLYSNSKENYLYTMFDKSFALNNAFSAFTLSGSLSNNYNYRVMLKDSDKWCVSDNVLDDYLNLHKSKWYEIEQSDDLVNSFENDEDLPKLTFSDSCDNFDFKNIKGLGVYYTLKDDIKTGYFQLKRVSAHQVLPKYAVFEKFIKEDNVSNLLFGLCTTPHRRVSKNETFIDNFKEWVSYIRWPGGSMIERYNLKEPENDGDVFSVGKWTEFMKDKIPSLEFLIGVSSKRAYNGDWNATEYGYGLVNYLNKDYNQSWGDNEALDKPTNLKFVEIGNEPNLEGLNADKYGPALVDYEKGIHKADSSVKIVAPTTTHAEIGNMLPQVLKEYGDSIDIVSAHNYTDNPKDYKDDLILIKSYINDFMSDNERRKKDEIKMAYTEYNSLAHTTRKGVIHEESWAKVIWHSETFSYFIQEGLYMASIWHAFFQGGHGVYQFDGTPYPIVSGIKFWKNHIDFSKHPKVLYSSYGDKDITITPIEMDDKLVVFVVNSSPESNKELNITFGSNEFFKDEVTITTLTHTPLSEYYDAKDLADNVSSNEAIMKKLKYLNPDAKIYVDEDDDNKTKIQFPKLDITQKSDSATLDNGILTYTFPKYTISILELEKK